MKIFIAKLARDVTGDLLRVWFEEYGKVTSAEIATNPRTGQPRSFGFVEMPNPRQIHDARFPRGENTCRPAKILAESCVCERWLAACIT